MICFPYYKDLQKTAGVENNFDKFKKGNFGLWYNKFIPVNKDDYKPFVEKKDKNQVVEDETTYYCRYFREVFQKENITELLLKKHIFQIGFLNSFEKSEDLESIVIKVKTQSPFVLGIGESHPHEISLVLDHNLGIPYIPASSIKGITRFVHTLSIFLKNDGSVKDEYKNENKIDLSITDIPDIFGGSRLKKENNNKENKDYKGKVIFLDAYPAEIPELKVDIMNPHYGDYYNDDKNTTPPADYLTPKPIKFLTVKEGTKFIFRALVPKELKEKVKKAYKKALIGEGVGAKTAIGYGRFENLTYEEPEMLMEKYEKWLEDQISPEEKEKRKQKEDKEKLKREKKEFIAKIKPGINQSQKDSVFVEWERKWGKNREIAEKLIKITKKHSGRGKKKKISKNYKMLAEILNIPLD